MIFAQARELRIVYSPITSAGPLPRVGRPAEAAALLRTRLEAEPVEVCSVILLTTRHTVIGLHDVARGTIDSCPVDPRGVFLPALLGHAAAVIVGHNHPSGDPTPSADDVALCGRLGQAGALLGIGLLDFVIIGAGGRYTSFKELGSVPGMPGGAAVRS